MGLNSKNKFKIEKIQNSLVKGVIYRYTHECGFILNFIPKRKFSKKFAGILVPLGSINNQIEVMGETMKLPAGSAHYMEHCIFSKDQGKGLLEKLSSLGANANAYTSNTHTMYYFTAVQNFFEALTLYFDSVNNPYLEEDRVNAERSIIIQELEMYEDDPDSKAYRKLLENLYESHPIKFDIGGTKESVSNLRSHHLKLCKEHFYNISKMSITIAGEIKQELIEEFLNSIEFPLDNLDEDTKYIFPIEKSGVVKKQDTIEMDVDVNSFLVGFKNPNVSAKNPLTGPERIMDQKGGQLYLEVLLGNSSEIYETLYSKGLINESFGFQYVCENTFSYFLMGSESCDPKAARKELIELLIEKINNGVDKREFNIQKKAALGNFIRSLDSVEHLGLASAVANISNTDIFTYPKLYDKLNSDIIREKLLFITEKNNESSIFVLKGEG